MDRRQFLLKTSVPALAALSLGLPGCHGDDDDATPPPVLPPPVGATEFPPITFLTSDPGFNDYRPAIDKTSTRVVFERTPFPNTGHANTMLYAASSIDLPNPPVAPFVPVPTMPPASYPYSQTRPDWSWASGEVVFSGATSETATIEAHLVSADGLSVTFVPDTLDHIYPIWSSDGLRIVIFNNSAGAAPVRPVTALISPTAATPPVPNLNGTDAGTPPVPMFGGFAAPMPGNAMQIAFAGQPALATWGVPAGQAPPIEAEYNQNNNYVFLNALVAGAYVSSPLEPAASVETFDPTHQGRAPYWSPDGKYIVFESSRAGGYALFLANVESAATGTPPVQLTDATYWAQHAKFFFDGKRIVFTALQQPNAQGTGPRGIGVIDITPFL